mmetsp:Transcript_16583/g.27954  ORF Transcript_16583/g.27954 Transcript_16583/m.27954 type:complete len:208 (-) Transcript_16583:866-1489(-)
MVPSELPVRKYLEDGLTAQVHTEELWSLIVRMCSNSSTLAVGSTMFHILTVWSTEPEMNHSLLLLMARQRMESLCPFSLGPIVVIAAPPYMLQALMYLPWPPEIIHFMLTLSMSIQLTAPACPTHVAANSPVEQSHTRTVLSSPPETMRWYMLPCLDTHVAHCRHCTAPLWPISVHFSSPDLTTHTLIIPALPAVAHNLPSGEKQQA